MGFNLDVNHFRAALLQFKALASTTMVLYSMVDIGGVQPQTLEPKV